MDVDAAKTELLRSLDAAHEAVVWKLEGLSELDVRRPMTPTGTNLLGVVKHLAAVEAGYLGDCFGRPFPEVVPGLGPGEEEGADLWATPDEGTAELVDRYRRVRAHSAATVAALPLDATGTVPWWPQDRRHPTLFRVVLHLVAETHRHAGHLDVVRELVDGAVGMRADATNLPQDADATTWAAHRARVQEAAEEAQRRAATS